MLLIFARHRSEEEIREGERTLFRAPNKDILEHERKRQIELKCAELQDTMEEQGYPDDEVEEKMTELRERLTAE